MIEDLILKLKKEIINELNLENITPEDMDAEAPLFRKGLGLDSIDALELVVLLEENYGIKIHASKEGPKIFYSIKTVAEYILDHQKK
jgi:acyl carrier protein